jgi:Tfp pilus assembly protein PilZ
VSRPDAVGPQGLERRRVERAVAAPSALAVSVVGARLVNVSRYGMMIESLVPFETDTVLQLRLVVDGQKADVEARVAACTAGAAGARRSYGIGLEFTHMPPPVRDRLARAIAASATARSA